MTDARVLRPYLAVLRARFMVLLSYRTAAWAGFLTQFAWGFMKIMAFEAFYRSTSQAQPMELAQVVSYVWLGQALLVMLPWNLDRDVADSVRTGSVVYDMLRPADLYSFWYARALALRTAPGILRAVPMFIVAGLFFGLQAPPTLAHLGAWLAATAGALLLSCALTAFLSVTLFWTTVGDGAWWLLAALVTVASGMVVPLVFFPDWAQPVLNALPFRLYSGHLAPSALSWVLANQLGWTLALVLSGRAILRGGLRRLTSHGG